MTATDYIVTFYTKEILDQSETYSYEASKMHYIY